MGSISRGDAINRFVQFYGNRVEDWFRPLLEGKTPTEIKNIEVDYYVQGDVIIDGREFPVHHRWASEEESDAGEELEEDYLKLENYFDTHIKGQSIEKIEMGNQDRDDEVYLTCFTKTGYDIDIPIGFDPETNKFVGYSNIILTEEEMELYLSLSGIDRIVDRWSYQSSDNVDTQAKYVEGVVNELDFDGEFDIEGVQKTISNYEKMSRIWQLYQIERHDAVKLFESIKKIVLM